MTTRTLRGCVVNFVSCAVAGTSCITAKGIELHAELLRLTAWKVGALFTGGRSVGAKLAACGGGVTEVKPPYNQRTVGG